MPAVTTFDQYQAEADAIANKSLTAKDRRIAAVLGVAGESGEVCDLIKKHVGHGRELDHGALAVECGDVLWSLAETATCFGVRLALVAGFVTFFTFEATAYAYLAMAEEIEPAEVALSLSRSAGRLSDYILTGGESPEAIAVLLRGVLDNVNLMVCLCGLSLQGVADVNLAKLRARYPNGFTTEASVARVDVKGAIA